MRVLFKQIAAAGDDTVYGLTQNGFVFYYHWTEKKWKPLPMEAESGDYLDVAPSSTIP